MSNHEDYSRLIGRRVELRPGFAGDRPAPCMLRGIVDYNARNGKFTLHGAEQYFPAEDRWDPVEFPIYGFGPWLNPVDWNASVL